MTLTSAWGLDLKEARMKGLVEELDTGYLKATKDNAKDLVIEVNQKRKKYYMKISSETGTTIKEVATRAAKKIKAKKK